MCFCLFAFVNNCICVLVLLVCCAAYCQSCGSLRASDALHSELLSDVLHLPVRVDQTIDLRKLLQTFTRVNVIFILLESCLMSFFKSYITSGRHQSQYNCNPAEKTSLYHNTPDIYITFHIWQRLLSEATCNAFEHFNQYGIKPLIFYPSFFRIYR